MKEIKDNILAAISYKIVRYQTGGRVQNTICCCKINSGKCGKVYSNFNIYIYILIILIHNTDKSIIFPTFD